jgi:predicted metal-binding protein
VCPHFYGLKTKPSKGVKNIKWRSHFMFWYNCFIEVWMTHSLLVCTTCASTWQNGKKVGISGGETLLKELSQLHQSWELRSHFEIRAVSCMSACSHACVVTFVAEGKYSYLFGDLPSDAENIPSTAAAILSCAEIYCDRADGMLAWKERPELLKSGVIARIPPL